MKLKIADIFVDFNNNYSENAGWPDRFRVSDETVPDEIITVDANDVEERKSSLDKKRTKNYKDSDFESLLFIERFAEVLPKYNAALVHSVVVEYNDMGVAFMAPSGTGKSTIAQNLKNYLGDELIIVNGDKPIIKILYARETKCEHIYAYGTPWRGKEHIGINGKTKLRQICFIERSEKNYILKINKKEAINRIIPFVFMPKNPMLISNTLNLINEIINSCDFWVVHCNTQSESAKITFETVFKNKK